jgi:hypothetical protein
MSGSDSSMVGVTSGSSSAYSVRSMASPAGSSKEVGSPIAAGPIPPDWKPLRPWVS